MGNHGTTSARGFFLKVSKVLHVRVIENFVSRLTTGTLLHYSTVEFFTKNHHCRNIATINDILFSDTVLQYSITKQYVTNFAIRNIVHVRTLASDW